MPMDTCQKYNLQIAQVSTAINLSDIYMAQKDTAKAINIVKDAFDKTYSSTNPNSKEKALTQLSDIYLQQNKPNEAFYYLTELNNHLQKYNDPSVLNDLKIKWGAFYSLKNQYAEAIKVLEEALIFAKYRNLVSQMLKIYDLKSNIYFKNKQYDLALENKDNFHRLNDTLAQKSKDETLIAIESRFQLNEKNKTIGDLSSDNQLKAQLLESSNGSKWDSDGTEPDLALTLVIVKADNTVESTVWTSDLVKLNAPVAQQHDFTTILPKLRMVDFTKTYALFLFDKDDATSENMGGISFNLKDMTKTKPATLILDCATCKVAFELKVTYE